MAEGQHAHGVLTEDIRSSVKPSFRSKDSARARKQFEDLKRIGQFLWGRPCWPWMVETRRFAAVVVHQLGQFEEGDLLSRNFISAHFHLKPAELDRFVAAELPRARYYTDFELGQITGLTAPVRYGRGITTVDAVDFPAVVRKRLQELKKNAHKRRKSASEPRQTRPERKTSRRLDAIVAVLPEDGSALSIKEISLRISTVPTFARLDAASRPKTVRRLVRSDEGQRRLVMTGRDVATTTSTVRRRLGAPVPQPRKAAPPPPPPGRSVSIPTDAIEYERWFFAELNCFTPENAAGMAAWFYSKEAKEIRKACRVTELEDAFAKIAKRRRDELLGTIAPTVGLRP